MKLGLISLGCAKNKIDSEMFLGLALKYGLEITNQLDDADVIVINTCGFIASSKQESIDTILEMLDYQQDGKVIVAMGCLVERYLTELKKEIPEVDYFIPIHNYLQFDQFFHELTSKKQNDNFNYHHRLLSTPKNTAYLRIAEGCNNRCHYCAIPIIRKGFVSRPFDEVMEEAKSLAEKGIKELTLIAQDTSAYGSDLENMSLAILLDALANLNSFKWIRVLYLYPDEITDELINVFKKHDSILNYFDIPIQHASNDILEKMHRRGSQEYISILIKKIRDTLPDAIIRTTLIVGFPTETKKDFSILKQFVEDTKFEHLGVFTYSDEDDTVAYTMHPKVSQKVMDQRKDEIMNLQMNINFERLNNLVGQTLNAIVDHYDSDINYYALRYYAQALDDVDGYIYVKSKHLNIGEFYDVEITGVDGYDLIGKVK